MPYVEGAPYSPPRESEIMAGDLVQVQLDLDIFKMMQNEEHGGWNDRMEMVRSSVYMMHIRVCELYQLSVSIPTAMIVCWSSWES